MTLALIFAVLVLVLLSGMPIFAGLGLVSIVLLLVTEGRIDSVADQVFGKLDSYLLVSIPLFALMAHVMVKAKVIDDLYRAAHTLVRNLPGGLGVATVLACTIFAAISGSSVATALTIGSTAIPQMIQYGYRPRDAYGVIAAGGTLGILIPPSGPMILYGVIANVSIGALFVAGILPGLLLALAFAAFCMLQAWSRGTSRLPAASLREIGRNLMRAFWALLLPPVVLGGIYFGVFTATEAAAAGAILGAVIAVAVYRMPLRDLMAAAYETVRTTAMLFMILAAAGLFGYVVTIMRLPLHLVEAVSQMGVGPILFVLAVMAVIFVLGMFLETISIILITTPVIFPTLLALKIDPVWYGVLLTINLELALVTPPVGMNLFVIKGVSNAPMTEVVMGVAPYIMLMLAGLALILLVPQLALWLPQTMGYATR
ncbi:MAG: TRAP transporter large permease [Rhodospirillaceae bacterium]|nr:TRAP transporter large permease [Rhodospirillaceae bacterium]